SSHISLYPILLPPTISLSFFFNDTAPPEIYTLSLHDALPISARTRAACRRSAARASGFRSSSTWSPCCSSFSTSRRYSLFLGERFTSGAQAAAPGGRAWGSCWSKCWCSCSFWPSGTCTSGSAGRSNGIDDINDVEGNREGRTCKRGVEGRRHDLTRLLQAVPARRSSTSFLNEVVDVKRVIETKEVSGQSPNYLLA